jgi:hypothetical protein
MTKKKKKFSQRELEYFTKGDPLYPDDKAKLKKLYEEKEEYLRSIGATDEQIEEGDDLCPEEFWFNACDIVADLAQELLDEREKKYDKLMGPIEDIERELKYLKKAVKSNFKQNGED